MGEARVPIMPFRRRRVVRRRRGRSSKTSTRAIALKALRAVDQEVKFIDVFGDNFITSNGSVTLLNLIPEGTSDNQRVGNSAKLHSVRLQMEMRSDPLAASSLLRVLVLIDKQPNGAFITLADIFEDTANATRTILSPIQMNSSKRIRVLRDRLFALNSTTRNILTSKMFIRLTLQPRWVGAASGIANLETGALLLILLSDEPVMFPELAFKSRLRFVG